jgi:hypothetical protein
MPSPGLQAIAAALLALALAGCDGNDAPDDVARPDRAREIAVVVPVDQALANAQVPRLDPETLNDAEIREALGTGPVCLFRYTAAGRPVLAVRQSPEEGPGGIVKLNNHLVRLGAARDATSDGHLVLAAPPVRLTVTPPLPEGEIPRRESDLVLEIGEMLRVGYRGNVSCRPAPPTATSRR